MKAFVLSKERRRREDSQLFVEETEEDDFDFDDEDLILHSMDDMMSSVRDGISQRNRSYHSLCPLGWIHVDDSTCGLYSWLFH